VSRSRRRRAAPGGGVSLRSTVSSSPSLRRAYYSWHSRAGVISRLPLLDDALSLSLSLPPSLSLSLSLSACGARGYFSIHREKREAVRRMRRGAPRRVCTACSATRGTVFSNFCTCSVAPAVSSFLSSVMLDSSISSNTGFSSSLVRG